MLVNEEKWMDISIDKLTEQYTFKIPEILKTRLSNLSADEKKRLNIRLMIDMAKAIHDSHFNPETYLTAQDG